MVVVPYYLSQGYNKRTEKQSDPEVVVPYYLSQGYNFTVCSVGVLAGCSSLLSLSRV